MKCGQTPPHLGEQIGTTAGQTDVQCTLGKCVCSSMCMCDRLAAFSTLQRRDGEGRDRKQSKSGWGAERGQYREMDDQRMMLTDDKEGKEAEGIILERTYGRGEMKDRWRRCSTVGIRELGIKEGGVKRRCKNPGMKRFRYTVKTFFSVLVWIRGSTHKTTCFSTF